MSFPTTLPVSRIPPAMEAPPLRWGVLGSGWIAEKFTESVQTHSQQIIAAVGSRDREKAQAFATRRNIAKAYGSYEDLLNDAEIDVIYVATPHNYHHAHALLALDANKHVLAEKPLALNHAQASEIIAMAQRKGVFFAEALWSYFLPKFDVLEQIFHAGVLGEIRSVYTDYGEYFSRQHRIFDPTLAGGPLLDLGTYPVSFLTKLLGLPDRLVGLGQPDPGGVNGQLAIIMANAAGNLGTMATTPYGFTPANAIITGTKASIWFDTEFHLPGAFTLRSHQDGKILRYAENRGAHFEGLYYEAAEVARCIASGHAQTMHRPWSASLDTMATLDRIRHCIGIDFTAANLQELQEPTH